MTGNGCLRRLYHILLTKGLLTEKDVEELEAQLEHKVPDLTEQANCPEDGCVVNFRGGREYWCEFADQDSQRTVKHPKTDVNVVLVKCTRLDTEVAAAID